MSHPLDEGRSVMGSVMGKALSALGRRSRGTPGGTAEPPTPTAAPADDIPVHNVPVHDAEELVSDMTATPPAGKSQSNGDDEPATRDEPETGDGTFSDDAPADESEAEKTQAEEAELNEPEPDEPDIDTPGAAENQPDNDTSASQEPAVTVSGGAGWDETQTMRPAQVENFATEHPSFDHTPLDTASTEAPTAGEPTPVPSVPVSGDSNGDEPESDSAAGKPESDDASWATEPAVPQYIPATKDDDQPKRGRQRGLIAAAALAAVVVIAVVAVALWSTMGRGGNTPPAADQAAEAALRFTTALKQGNLGMLRSVTCGDRKQFYDSVNDNDFQKQYQTQKANNELVEVKKVNASRVTGAGTAVVEVSAVRTDNPNAAANVQLLLHKESDQWKVCGSR